MGASRPESGYNITLSGFSYIFDVLLEYIIVSYFFKGISGLCNDIFLRCVCTCWFETFLIPFFCFLCILFIFECSFLAVFVINKYFRYKIELILLVLLISIIDNYSTMPYDLFSKKINRAIRDEKPTLHNNQAVRKFAVNKYKDFGLNTPQANERASTKDTGHILGQHRR